jgi:hypothetical protein
MLHSKSNECFKVMDMFCCGPLGLATGRVDLMSPLNNYDSVSLSYLQSSQATTVAAPTPPGSQARNDCDWHFC